MPFANSKHRYTDCSLTYQPDYCDLQNTCDSTMTGIYQNERLAGMSIHSSLLLNDHFNDCHSITKFEPSCAGREGSDRAKKGLKRTRSSMKYVSFDPKPDIIPSTVFKPAQVPAIEVGMFHQHKLSRQ